ncbi:dynein axonemal assembly factor 4-like [Macrobrachium rosenbergii]|uniref:dynein axonemal assembly factor 4-like n=1 Tax=Macrobrachium rosenbergii TaxID=79674 RepID=UPI0034D69F89
MPIHVSDYIWHQTDGKILLSLDLHHTSPKNVDIVTTNSYLKVSFLPYIFEAFLCHMISVDRSTARITNGRLELDLAKETDALWSNLCLKLSQEEMQQRREEANKDVEMQEGIKLKKKKEEKIVRERFAVSQQILEDDREKQECKKKIEEEKAKFMKQAFNGNIANNDSASSKDSESIRSRLSSTCSEDGFVIASEGDYDGDGEDSHYYSSTENLLKIGKSKTERVESAKKQLRKCASGRKSNLKEGKKGFDREVRKDEKKRGLLPPVRQNGTIRVNYTKRVFPTPSRESRKEEEDEWLASHSTVKVDETKTESVTAHSVDFYKEKAAALFENGDYRGCINAYTEAINLTPNVASLYSNRAAASLALNNLHHAINDCSKALELLTPPTADNSKSRLLCHIRRGTAFVGLGLYSEGLLDYRAAHKLSPDDESLLKDEQRIQAIMMASTDSGESNENDSEAEGEG